MILHYNNGLSGDVVFLAGTNASVSATTAMTNWLAVVRFANPADPAGTQGYAAVEAQAFFPTSAVDADGFTNFTLFPHVIYVTGTRTVTNGFITVAASYGDAAFGVFGELDYYTVYLSATHVPGGLRLSASAAPEPVVVGSNLVYSLTVSNVMNRTATGVVISNKFPANIKFVSATGGTVTTNNGVLRISLAPLAPGAVATAQVVMQTTTVEVINNLFAVYCNQPDPDPNNGYAPVLSIVNGVSTAISADVGVYTNSLSFDSTYETADVTKGVKLTYILTVSNGGPATATGILISNQLAANFNFISATGGTVSTNNGVLLVKLAPLANGATNQIIVTMQPTIQYLVPAYSEIISYEPFAMFTNTFEVFADEYDPVAGNNIVTVVDGVLAALPGTPLVWQNPGGQSVVTILGTGYGVQPIVPIFSGTNAVPGDAVILASTNGSASDNVNPTNWAAVIRFFNPADPTGVLGLPATEQLTYCGGNVTNDFAGFTLFPNTVYLPNYAFSTFSVSASAVQFGPVGGILAGQEDIAIYLALAQPTNTDLILSSTALPSPVTVGSNLVYTLTVSNAGPSAATGVVISNQLPAGVNFVSATGGATPSGGALLVNLGSIPVNATGTAQIVVQPTSTGMLTNLFRASDDQTNPVAADGMATVVTSVGDISAAAGLNLSASGSPGQVTVGSNLVYSLTISNAGPATATGVVLGNPQPANVQFLWATGVSAVNATGGNVRMNVGTLAAGASQAVQITVQPTAAGQLTNVFQVSAVQANPVPGNSSATVVSSVTNAPVVSQADLALSASAVFVQNGSLDSSNLVYTLTVSNAGPATATDVVISNQVPPNGAVVSVTGGATPTNGVLLVDLGPLGAGATNQVQLVESYSIVGDTTTNDLTNAFTVYADQPDPNLANNYTNTVTIINVPRTFFTTTTRFEVTNLTANVKQQATNFTTELIAKLANGTVVYDMTFSNAYTDPTVQAAVTTAAADLSGDGDSSYSGPTEKSFAKTLENKTSVTVTNPVGTNITVTVTTYVGPTNILVGNDQTNSLTLTAGATDIDTLITDELTNLLTTTLTSNYLNSAVYVMTGIVVATSADVSLHVSAPVLVVGGSPFTNTLTVSNAGPATATGVVITNLFPADATLVSATGGATPAGGLLVLNLGTLAVGATSSAQIIESISGAATNLFQVSASQTDPKLTNNVATVVTGAQGPNLTTTSTATTNTNVTVVITQQATNFTTELIAKLPNGTVVYDMTFSNIFSDPTVQAAVTTAAGDLSGDGAGTYAGPTLTSFMQNLEGRSSVTMTNPIGTNTTLNVTVYTGPTNILVGTGRTNALTLLFGVTDIDSLFTTDITNLLTTTVTSNYLNSSVYVMTGIVTAVTVDVALSVTPSPDPVNVGSPLTYSLTVTNNSTNTATAVVVTDTLPASVIFNSVLPSPGTATNHAGVVTYDVGSLAQGAAATLAIVVVPTAAGQLTNEATASSAQPDAQPANNSVQTVTTAVSVPITNLVLTVLTGITLDPQTGLYEQQIEVSNGGPATPSSVLVFIHGLAANAKLYNATGTSNGVPYVQSIVPLGVGSNVIFTVEYYVPTRVAPADLTYTVVGGPAVTPPVASGTILGISQAVILDGGDVLVEFGATPGRIYAIQYSSDMLTWRTAVPVITAPGTQVQWIDSGPPKTVSSPAGQEARYYRVVLLN